MRIFQKGDLKRIYKPLTDSSGEDNGQITIIGGSNLFHGAPILSLKAASRIVDMVFFASPEECIGKVAERIKSELMSFIWVPWDEVESYIEKSDAVLIGPGFMRYKRERKNLKTEKLKNKKLDSSGKQTKNITEKLLKKFPDKKWVIDAGSLQVIDPELLPKGCIVTPNKKEFEILFGSEIFRLPSVAQDDKFGIKSLPNLSNVRSMAMKYKCIIVLKGPETIVCSPKESMLIKGGNPGLTKGGTGDVLAGLTVALLAKNDPFLSACAASFVAKRAADDLYQERGVYYNADDLAERIPEMLHKFLNSSHTR
jgi:hydroxyethylthiazole kinase-like uncharacterized protein yjeF